MEEPPRAQSAMQMHQSPFQARASQFLKKVSTIRGRLTRRNPGTNQEPEGPYKRQTRSMDIGRKPYMSQPVLGLEMPNSGNSMDTDSSSQSASSGQHSPSHNSRQVPPWESHGNTIMNSTTFPGTRDARVNERPATLHKPKSVGNLVVRHRNATQPRGPPLQISTSSGTPDIMVSQPLISTEREFQARSLGESNNQSIDTYPTPKPSRSNMLGGAEERPPALSSSFAPAPPVALPVNSGSLGPSSSPKPRLGTLPQASFKRLSMEGGVRLSPSIVTRMPMPILHLPTLPPPTPVEPERPAHHASRLRSMPALPIQGPHDRDDDPEQEHAGLGESDEEDEGDDMEMESDSHERDMTGSDDEDGDDTRSHRSSISEGDHSRPALPSVDTSRLDLSFLNRPPPGTSGHSPPIQQVDRTPIATHAVDYFSPKAPERHQTSPRTPRPGDLTRAYATTGRTPEMVLHPAPLVPGSTRPGLYHVASKSMVNILTFKEIMTPTIADEHPPSPVVGKGKARESLIEPGSYAVPAYLQSPKTVPHGVSLGGGDDKLSPSLRRRRSMPMFNESSDPPPYPSFLPHSSRQHFAIQPREDEGHEQLPPYSNSIYLSAIMPRKLEFSKPGVQARDRKWRRVLCVLDGTAFKVYKCPPGASGVGLIGEWWEKKVGVGDVSAAAPVTSAPRKKEMVRSTKLDEDARSPSCQPADIHREGPRQERDLSSRPESPASSLHRSKLNVAAALLHPSSHSRSHSHSRSASDVTHDQSPSRSSFSLSRPTSRLASRSPGPTSQSHNSTTVGIPSSASSPPSSSSRSHFLPSGHASSVRRTADLHEPDPADLLRLYTLQHAESGLGNDYLKRKNVIRVRMEGEQFLLQAQNVARVVEWIEGFHAATNIALDLDERVMPKGPMFPRRRRRRVRRPDADDIQRPSSSSRPHPT